jgi:hypothetical protein
MGISIYGGNWDMTTEYYSQRPKIPGVTDINIPLQELDTDAIVLFQTMDFPSKAFHYLINYDIPVYALVFGQGWYKERIDRICELALDYPQLSVVAYSKTEYDVYLRHGCPTEQLFLIRFPKYLEDYGPWLGGEKFCYTSCNSINRPDRAQACGAHVLAELSFKKEIPIVLSGNETETILNGKGRLSWENQRKLFNTCGCYLSTGTIPASLTLSLIEAMCGGTPTIAYDNGCGVTNEDLTGVFISKSVDALAENIKRCIDDWDYAKFMGDQALFCAKELFDVKVISKQWEELIGNTV